MSTQIVMLLPPEAASVSLARHRLAEALENAKVSPDCIYEAQLALSEACTNVLHHVPASQNFEVVINVGARELTMHILDSGPGFPRGRPLSDWPDEVPEITEIAENGRGMALMTAFTDKACFASTGKGGSVRLTKLLRWTAETEGAAHV